MKAIVAILLIALPMLGQTRHQFSQKYGSPQVNVYKVRPSIIMPIKFAGASFWKDDACEAVIKPGATAISNADSSATMPAALVLEIIDEVVPITQRGKLVEEFSVNGGCTGMQIGVYEHVIINRVTRCEAAGGGTYQASIKWKTGWCADDKP